MEKIDDNLSLEIELNVSGNDTVWFDWDSILNVLKDPNYQNFVYNVLVVLFRYIPHLIFAYKYLKELYVESFQRRLKRLADIEDVQNQIHIMNNKLLLYTDDYGKKSKLLKTQLERFISIRNRVKSLITKEKALYLKQIQTYEDAIIDRANLDLYLATDVLYDMKYDEPLGETMKPKFNNYLEDFINSYNVTPSTSDETIENNTAAKAKGDHAANEYTDKKYGVVKVINIYKVAYLKNNMKMKRLKRQQRQAQLKKQAEEIKKLFDDWQNSLSSVVTRKIIRKTSGNDMSNSSDERRSECGGSCSDTDSEISPLEPRISCTQCASEHSLRTLYENTMASDAMNYIEAIEKCCNEQNELAQQQFQDKPVLFALPEETSSELALATRED